jgi:hypothetical protein
VIDARWAASPAARNSRADDAIGGLGIHERILEEAEHELLTQQASPRDIEALLADQTVGDEPGQDLGALLTPELVGAGVEDLRIARRGEVLDTPGARGTQVPMISLSVMRPQSVQTMPSNPNRRGGARARPC